MTDKQRTFKIFIDFDGTITKKDVGAGIFRQFGSLDKVNRIIESMHNNEFSRRDGWAKLFDSLPPVTEKELEDFVLGFEIDDDFKDFLDFAAEIGADITILSDGFDFYIERILRREGLSHLNYYSNKLALPGDGSFQVEFPFTDEECTFCAHCKRNRILTLSSDEDFTVYIGDGHSDQCPAQYVDFIFAKDDLLRFCEMERITFFPYHNFNDVKIRLQSLLQKKRLKKRHQSLMKRRAVYMQG